MTNPWPSLAAQAGRRCVMSMTIDDATLDTETARQCTEIFPLLRPLLTGNERLVLDYGCGAGRFTLPLAQACGCMAIGYDPCVELVNEAPKHDMVRYVTGAGPAEFLAGVHQAHWQFDVAFAAMVLGHPGMDTPKMAEDLVSVLAPGGLMVVIDHMPDVPPPGKWWRYMPIFYYVDVFADYGVEMKRTGSTMQLANEVTVLCGRRSRP